MSFIPRKLEGTALSGDTGSAEESMKVGGVRYESQDEHERNMYYDAAKRVVFKNCFSSCDLSEETVPHFNGNFYYNMYDAQKCLQTCYNTKMNLHFGKTLAEKECLYLDFVKGKAGYQSYENWNPTHKVAKQFESGTTEEKIVEITNTLLDRTKQAKGY